MWRPAPSSKVAQRYAEAPVKPAAIMDDTPRCLALRPPPHFVHDAWHRHSIPRQHGALWPSTFDQLQRCGIVPAIHHGVGRLQQGASLVCNACIHTLQLSQTCSRYSEPSQPCSPHELRHGCVCHLLAARTLVEILEHLPVAMDTCCHVSFQVASVQALQCQPETE